VTDGVEDETVNGSRVQSLMNTSYCTTIKNRGIRSSAGSSRCWAGTARRSCCTTGVGRQRQIGRVEHGDTRRPASISSVSPAMLVPPPGFGMIELICVIAFV
jgi:hypothetical protein